MQNRCMKCRKSNKAKWMNMSKWKEIETSEISNTKQKPFKNMRWKTPNSTMTHCSKVTACAVYQRGFGFKWQIVTKVRTRSPDIGPVALWVVLVQMPAGAELWASSHCCPLPAHTAHTSCRRPVPAGHAEDKISKHPHIIIFLVRSRENDQTGSRLLTPVIFHMSSPYCIVKNM